MLLPPLQLLLAFFIAAPGIAASQLSVPVAPKDTVSAANSAQTVESAQKALAGGHPDDALRQLDSLAKLDPEPAGVERLRGFIYYQQRNMAGAEAAYAKAIQQDPTDRDSMQMRGVTLYSLGRPSDAIPLLEKARVAIPSVNVDPNYVLGVCYIATRRYDDARRAFAIQYDFPPESAAAYLLAARLLLRQEHPIEAADFTRKALALKADLPLAHLLLGEIALARAQLPEAITELTIERTLNPLDGNVYDRLGDAYVRSGDDMKAQEALSRAVLLEPKTTGPYILLGKVMLNQQNYLLATLYLERALSMDPSNYITHSLLGQAYRRVGRTVEASKEFETADRLQNGRKPATAAPKLDSAN